MITVKQTAGTSSVEIRFFNTTDHDWPFCDFDLNPHNPSVVLRLVTPTAEELMRAGAE